MWKFPERIPGRIIVDPVQDAFFAEATDDKTPSNLVRESIQNSLDARKGNERVRMRFTFGNLDLDTVREVYGGLNRHLTAPDNGLLEPPDAGDPLRFLAIEDFGTTGLTGDVSQLDIRDDDEQNNFFYFWRNIGRSGKSGDQLGSWGLGKSVFAAASDINTYFGITCRQDDLDQSYLMGMCVLKTHKVGEHTYEPYGYFQAAGTDDPMPITDFETIERFRTKFHLARAPRQSGLSIVIPHVVPEFTVALLKEVAVEHYFWPILNGRLSIEIQEDYLTDPETVLNRDELLAMCGRGEVSQGQELTDTIILAAAALRGDPVPRTRIPTPSTGTSPQWSDIALPPDVSESLKGAIQTREPFAVAVDVPIRFRDGTTLLSKFQVLGQRVEYSVRRRSYFVRGGSHIQRACRPNPPGYLFIVVAEDRPLAEMLAAAENPSHSEFELTATIKSTYRHGVMTTIGFVAGAPSGIARLVELDEDESDADLFSGIFWKPGKDQDTIAPTRPKKRRRRNVVIEPPPPRKPRAYAVRKSSEGFVVTLTGESERNIEGLTIQLAYDSERSDPIKAHQPWDFDLTRSDTAGLKIESQGCSVEFVRANEVRLKDIEDTLSFSVSGFDPSRDIVVKPRAVYE